MNRFRILPIGLLLAGITLSATEPAPADLAAKLLGVDAAQQAVWTRAAKAGVLEVSPVHLPVNAPGDCNHYGWPVATLAGDALIVMHRRIPGHRAKGAAGPHPKMSYGVVLRSTDGGKTWSRWVFGQTVFSSRDARGHANRVARMKIFRPIVGFII